MINKLLFALVIFPFLIFAQDDKSENPGVELPDFVIVGKDVVSIQKSSKKDPDFISTISDNFLKPGYFTDDLPVKDISNPLTNDLDLFDTTNFYNGLLEFGAGIYTVPKARILYGVPFQNGIFQGYFSGINQTDYVENSAMNSFSGGANLTFFVNDDSPILPGLEFKVYGDYGSSNFKFFASQTPELKRSINKGDFYVNAKNLMNKHFIFDARVFDQFTSLTNDDFSENLSGLSGYTQVSFEGFNIGAAVDFKNQFLTVGVTDSTVNKNQNEFFGLKPTVGINISDLFKIKIGFDYSTSGGGNYFVPYASAGIMLSKNLSFFGEFNPHRVLFTEGDFLRKNRYYNPLNSSNVLMKKKNSFKAVLKYEYGKYFEIDGGAFYYGAENLPYFTASAESGRFDVIKTEAVSFGLFANLLFHLGPLGQFYGSAEFNNTEDEDGKIIPYYPQIKTSLFYSYEFVNKLTVKANLNFYSERYADIENTISLGSYFNMGFGLDYELIDQFHLTFEISNLTGNSNYIWKDYKELPLNAVGGFNFRW